MWASVLVRVMVIKDLTMFDVKYEFLDIIKNELRPVVRSFNCGENWHDPVKCKVGNS